MTKDDVKLVLKVLSENSPNGYYPTLLMPAIDRAIQTAQQIGSSWPNPHINLICHDPTGNGRFRMVIE